MAIGKKHRSDLVAYSFKIKAKDLPAPIFEIQKRNGDKWEPNGTTDTVSGTITAIEPKEFKHEGKIIKSVSVTLQDAGDIYFVTIPYTNLGRGLMNSLLNLKAFTEVEIGLYQTKPRDGNPKTYAAVALRQAGEIVRWRFEQKDVPPPLEVKFKGEVQRDWSAAEDFFAKHLAEFGKTIKSVPSTPASTSAGAPVDDTPKTDTPSAPTPPPSEPEADDSVPF